MLYLFYISWVKQSWRGINLFLHVVYAILGGVFFSCQEVALRIRVDRTYLNCYWLIHRNLLRKKSLKIKFRSPMDQIMGPLREVFLKDPISLADLLRFLTAETPGLSPYSGFGPKDVQPYGLLVWRDGKLLTLADILNPADELEMIPMAAGG